MNKLITTASGGFPLKLNDIRWNDDAYREAFKNICKAIAKMTQVDESFILWGCSIVETPPESGQYAVSSGYIFIGGEICELYETVVVPAGGELIYYVFDDASYNAAGNKLFKSGVSHDTYNIRRCIMTCASSPPANSLSWGNAKTLTQLIENVSDARFDTVEGRATTLEGKVSNIEAAWSIYSYNSGNYTGGGGGTWIVEEGDQDVRYKINGKTMHININITSSQVTTTCSSLDITIPASKNTPAGKTYWGIVRTVKSGGTVAVAYAQITGTKISIIGLDWLDGEYWNLFTTLTFEIQ